MAAKKNSAAQNNDESAEIADQLGDGEKIIIQDTRTIQKQTVPGQSSQSKTIDIEPEMEYDDDDDLPYSENSLAALIENDGETVENEFCTVSIRREPDNFGDNFLKPSKSRLQLPPMRNVELTADRSDIEETVRASEGGGHYLFQIYYGGKLGASWKNSLSDSPEAIAKAAAATAASQPAQNTPPAAAATPAPEVNPIDAFIAEEKRRKALRETLFGDELKELERLREEVRQSKTDSDRPPENEKLAILQYADKLQSKEMQEKVLGFVFGEESSGGGLLDTAKFLFDNDDKILGIGQKLLGMVGIGGAPGTQDDLEAMLRAAPPVTENPANALPPTRSNFRRQKPPTETKPERKTKTK